MHKRLYILLWLGAALQLVACGTYKSVHNKPILEGYNATPPVVVQYSDTSFSYKNNFLVKNRQQLWELYVEGDALQRGLINGALTQDLIKKQEGSFVKKVDELVPSKFKQALLRQFLKWYNRKLYLNVPEEYKTEIYGISRYSSHEFDNIAPPYLRSLYLHGAHDIGHALSDLALVGCTSFAVWDDKSEDGLLLLARNLDFYAGDEFAENKLVSFVKPEKGYPFMSVSWAGMIGTLSGMNLQGLTVTINAGKSDIPLVAKTPISLLTREILQYAKNIDEAVAIAKKRKVFVSESIMVGSANDHKAVLIEVSPNKLDVYDVPNTSQLICTNHFQGAAYKDDDNNRAAIRDSHSEYRFERMTQLLDQNDKINPVKAATIMRSTTGLNGIALGYGNEKAINQLLAHHSVIFKPEQRLVWVASSPYMLGAYVAYDLNEIFKGQDTGTTGKPMGIDSLLIPEDPFVHSQAYWDYETFRKQDRIIDRGLEDKKGLSVDFIKEYQALNPDYWVVYYKVGRYYYDKGYYTAAREQFKKALTKVITTLPDREATQEYLNKATRKSGGE
ncbi:C45 family autoproteolytic acyltransferase/hydolase [Flavobacterium rhizosphaerae]|uniref:C45 family peptidase n=1 Tax=Flavobacterium rhizosphaerae TaxID=3163298 RepID=A0ABW8YXC9_9FLAO